MLILLPDGYIITVDGYLTLVICFKVCRRYMYNVWSEVDVWIMKKRERRDFFLYFKIFILIWWKEKRKIFKQYHLQITFLDFFSFIKSIIIIHDKLHKMNKTWNLKITIQWMPWKNVFLIFEGEHHRLNHGKLNEIYLEKKIPPKNLPQFWVFSFPLLSFPWSIDPILFRLLPSWW